MPVIKKEYRIRKRDFIRAGEASINAQNVLKSLSLDPKLIRRFAICGYEGEMNAVMHGGEGSLRMEIYTDKIVLNVSDSGCGIKNIELAMKEGYSTATDEVREMGFGAGMGLPNMKKNADQIYIDSETGKGTSVKMIFALPGKGESA
jgi:serine/threonine-protein kinase RsbT